jgi:hypothetical protein
MVSSLYTKSCISRSTGINIFGCVRATPGPSTTTKAPTASSTGSPSIDGQCGAHGNICLGSVFGDCCPSGDWCGNSTVHCRSGCQSSFGTCNTAGDKVSTDAKCGSNGKTCKGCGFGDCCSSSGYCGDTTGHCGAGCQSGFGVCPLESSDI